MATIKKKVPFFGKGPYGSKSEAYLGKERGNLARTISKKPKKRVAPKYTVPKTPKVSGLKWGG